MLYQFAEFELDEERRELRLRGHEIVLQPRAFDLLAYLVRNRERVVSKEELLDALWPGVIVVDGALQRVVSLARSALQRGAAGRGLERALEDQRWSNRQRRSLLLAYLAIVAQAAGQSDRAREALKELDEHPELWSAPALAATVERARAEAALCEGSHTDAIGSLRRGLQRWQEIGSPLNVASFRLRLPELLCTDGDPRNRGA